MNLPSHADLVVRGRRTWVHDGETVVQRPAAVVVRAGRIAGVVGYDDVSESEHVVDLRDDEVLLPGVVDTHVHVNEPGRTEWEGFATATRAAAAGGVTTVLDMPLNSVPPTVTVTALDTKRAAARGQAWVDVGFWGGAVPDHLDEVPALVRAGAFGVKCFLVDSGVAEFPPLDPAGLRAALRRAREVDAVVLVHAEDARVLAEAGTPRSSGPSAASSSFAGFLASRPAAAEETAVAEVVAAARETGGRAHVVHLSSAGALPLLAQARAEGVAVTVETCPHYLAIDAAEVPDGATQYKCCPPVRDAANQDLLWQGLREGVVDAVVSDHSPCTPELKRLDEGDFLSAWGGIASVQLGLPVVWSAAQRRAVPLPEVVRWMTSGPARVAGLRHKGRIAPGYDGDLVAFAPDETWVVDARRLHHRHAVTPYDGRTLQGVVRRTWLRGVPVHGPGAVAEPCGRLLTRGAA